MTLAANTCNGSGSNAVAGYYAHAEPVTLGSTGQRAFATDTRSTIYQDTAGVQIPDPPTAGGTIYPVQ